MTPNLSYFIPFVTLALGATGIGQDQYTLYARHGAPGDGFGRVVSRLGDINGDGFPDYVVGSLNIPPN